MKGILTLSIITLTLVASCARVVNAGESRQQKIVDTRQQFIHAAKSAREGISLRLKYLETKDTTYFAQAVQAFVLADSLFGKLVSCCAKDADTSSVDLIRSMAKREAHVTIEEIDTASSDSQKQQLHAYGVTYVVSEREAAHLTYLIIGDIKCQDIASRNALKTVLLKKWSAGGKSFEMKASTTKGWQTLIEKVGLKSRYFPVEISLINDLGRDVQLNPMLDKFTILTTDGKQYSNVEPDFDASIAMSNLTDQQQQMIFDKVIDVYDGGKVSIVVFFSANLPAEDLWNRIIFDPTLGEIGEGLSKGVLIRQ